jgi:hypothetical protein
VEGRTFRTAEDIHQPQFFNGIAMNNPLVHINAANFQNQLVRLAETIAQKLKREASNQLPGVPGFVSFDLHVLTRQAMQTYDLFFYINADERREKDCYWRPAYSVVILPLIRNMIDCLYNITSILQNPRVNGPWYKMAGFKKLLEALDEDQKRYGGRPDWDQWIKRGRDFFDFEVRRHNLTMVEVLAQPPWPTLGQYIGRQHKGGTYTRHQDFLRSLVYGPWREYSAIAHGGSDGLTPIAVYFVSDSLTHEQRDDFETHHPRLLFMHLTRAAAMLLCMVTEVQAHFRFDGATINERICEVWSVLKPAFEVQELYGQRYEKLMKNAGIEP